ncbi:hypothetical protein D9M69_721780 [compost metagenome]
MIFHVGDPGAVLFLPEYQYGSRLKVFIDPAERLPEVGIHIRKGKSAAFPLRAGRHKYFISTGGEVEEEE